MEENQKVEPVQADKEQRTWAMLCHLSALAGFIVPMGSVIGPLIVWLIKKEDMPLVAEHGRKSLNFQITMLIAYIPKPSQDAEFSVSQGLNIKALLCKNDGPF